MIAWLGWEEAGEGGSENRYPRSPSEPEISDNGWERMVWRL